MTPVEGARSTAEVGGLGDWSWLDAMPNGAPIAHTYDLLTLIVNI